MKFFINRYSSHKVEDNPLYLVVLADIMTNLMLFFLILYVFTIRPELKAADFMNGFDENASKEQREKKAEEIIKKFTEQDLAKKLAEDLLKAGMKDMAEVQITAKQIKINIAAPVLFKSGKAEVGSSAARLLREVAGALNTLPNDIIIEGHTDAIPIRSGDYATNWQLSAARANAVVDLLAKDYGVPQERMIAAAYGEHRPAAPNDTAEGRARNRRIEIIVPRE